MQFFPVYQGMALISHNCNMQWAIATCCSKAVLLFYCYHQANEVWCKVMLLHLSVSHSVHWGAVYPIAYWDTPPRPDTPQADTHQADTLGRHPPTQAIPQILRDTVNKRAVHILLECMLVIFVFWLCSITEDQSVERKYQESFCGSQ